MGKFIRAGLAALSIAMALSLSSVTSAEPNAASVMEFNERAASYAAQQKQLQNELGSRYFVASYKALVYQNRLITFATWTDTVLTALPKTDFIWLQDAKASFWFVVSWSDLEKAIGVIPKMDVAGPPRYLTPASIPAAYFAALKENFVPASGFPERVASGRN